MTILDKAAKPTEENFDLDTGAALENITDTSELSGMSKSFKQKSLKQDMVNFTVNKGKKNTYSLPKLKELLFLKEGVYSVDLEKTINDMFIVINNMESQLESVMKINASLERDLMDSKEIIADLKKTNSDFEEKIDQLENDIPAKRELQIEIDYQVDERNKAELAIRELKRKIDKMKDGYSESIQKSGSLEVQKEDFVLEINYLESRLHQAGQTIKQYEKQMHLLKGEQLAHTEKLKSFEKELKITINEKYSLTNELNASKNAVNELHSALQESKHSVKKNFYKNFEEEEDKTESINVKETEQREATDEFEKIIEKNSEIENIDDIELM